MIRLVKKHKGQTILEAVIALAAILLILAAVSVAVVTSVNNSNYIKNQNVANKYAQDGVEYVRNSISSDNVLYAKFANNLPANGEVCLGNISPGTDPINVSCSKANGVNIQPSYIRTVQFVKGSCGQTDNSFTNGLVVTVKVYWSSGKCPSNNTFCHKQETKTCFIDPSVAAPTPGI